MDSESIDNDAQQGAPAQAHWPHRVDCRSGPLHRATRVARGIADFTGIDGLGHQPHRVVAELDGVRGKVYSRNLLGDE